jgi:Fe-S cluster biogenesis protein NfuA
MTTTLDARDFQARLERLDALLQQVERSADPAGRARTQELVQAVLALHGSGLQRLLERLAEAGEAGQTILNACAGDDLIRGLLLLHGLHPQDLETRVREALDEVRPYLRKHGGSVELLGVEGGVVRLRLGGSCDGCPSSAVTMRQTIEAAILAKAPDAAAVEVEGLMGEPANGPARLALPLV